MDLRIDQLSGISNGITHKIEGLANQAPQEESGLEVNDQRAGDIAKEFGLSTGDFKGNFSDLITRTMDKVNADQVNADSAIKEMVSGRNKNIHETMLAVEKADLSLKLMMQVRNKVLDAYREVMRMQV